jgi:hypothetical protein
MRVMRPCGPRVTEVDIDPVHWFLSPAKDTRSSLYLEDAATEFQVQGLELDWTKSHVASLTGH